MDEWTEKYRPKTLLEIVGNEKAITALRTWAERWNQEKIPKQHKAVILTGKPGTGKTSSAYALAHDYRWAIVELNASDARNASTIKKVATSGSLNETFDDTGQFISARRGGRKLIILDEADNLYERIEKSEGSQDFSDRGGKKAIVETIQVTCQPIILIVNDLYALLRGGGEQLRNLCTTITFYDVSTTQMVELLKRICREENIVADIKFLQTIADRSKGDVRSAVKDLQTLSIDRQRVDVDMLIALGYRDHEKRIFDAVRDVFKTRSIQGIRDEVYSIDMPPDMFLLWLSENLPREYRDIDDLVRGYNAVSKADIFFGRVYRRQYYSLWSYASEIMTGGISTAKTHMYGLVQYSPPVWMREMKQQRSSRGIRDSIMKKLSMVCHCSTRKVKETYFPFFKELFCTDTRFACMLTNMFDFSDEEVAYILGKQYEHKMKDILVCAEKTDEKQTAIIQPVHEAASDKKEEKQEKKQPSLFDFSQ